MMNTGRSTVKQHLLSQVDRLKQILVSLKNQGQDAVFFYRASGPVVRQAQTSKPAKTAANVQSRSGQAPQSEFEQLACKVKICVRCAIAKQRKQAVFGEGNEKPRLVFVGEAPGADEDREGRPFVGAAGKLLTKIIESIGLKREDVYICNVLKCRPTGNRNPLPEEIENCRPYLEQQLAYLKPELICALGTFAVQTLLNTKDPIGKLRGRTFTYQGIPVIPTLHPAALLYHPQNKRLVWEDMKQIAQHLKLPLKP